MLPRLATYLGHASLASTELYLHFLPTVQAAASARFAAAYGSLLTSPGVRGGGA